MFWKLFLVMVLSLFTGVPAYSEVKVNSYSYELGNFPLLKTDYKGNVYVAYYSKDGSLYIKKNKRQEVKIGVEGGKGTFVDLTFFGEDIVLTWTPKLATGEKFVYVQRSTDGGRTFSKPIVLNTASHALPPVHVASDGKGRMYVVWVDEREGHRLYMNYSLDGGKTFLEKDVNLTPDFKAATRPYLIVDGDRAHLFFLGSRGGDKEKAEVGIFYRQSRDMGRTWSEVIKIQGLVDWTPSLISAVKSGENIMVFWAGVLGLYGASSKDGVEWKATEFKETIEQDINRLDVQADKKGDVFIATSWKKWGSHYTVKPSVYFYRSEDNGNSWSGPQRLNRNKYDNTSSYLPAMHVKDEGTILVAWQDHRNIRGDIYINYSKDYGKTWLEKDINIEKAEGRDNSFFPFVANYGDKYYAFWIRYADDRMEEADLYMEEVKIK